MSQCTSNLCLCLVSFEGQHSVYVKCSTVCLQLVLVNSKFFLLFSSQKTDTNACFKHHVYKVWIHVAIFFTWPRNTFLLLSTSVLLAVCCFSNIWFCLVESHLWVSTLLKLESTFILAVAHEFQARQTRCDQQLLFCVHLPYGHFGSSYFFVS